MKTMTAAEFRCTREALGLPLNWVAANVGVTERTVNRWELGTVPIACYANEALALLDEYTSKCVSHLAKRGGATKPIRTYTDAIASVGPDEFPASWHRAACRRAAEVSGRTIVYDDEAPVDLPPLTNVEKAVK